MADAGNKARSLEETPTWAVAAVCFVLVLVSIFIEHAIHSLGKWLKKKDKTALGEALEKVKAELMLMGFLSLLLTVLQGPISDLCISPSLADTWHPCDKNSTSKYQSKEIDKCKTKGKVAFVSAYGIHQLHIFIFVLAVFHILNCIITYALGNSKMKTWKAWENETKRTDLKFSTSMHPQTDGQTERVNGLLEVYLRHYVSATQRDWPKLLDVAQFSYNLQKSEATGRSPFEIVLGHQPLTPSTISLGYTGPNI